MLSLLLSLIDDKDDHEKFLNLYRKYRQLMLKISYDLVHDYNLAEDCVQSAFMDIAKNIEKVDDIDSKETKAYVVVITKTCAYKTFSIMCPKEELELSESSIEKEGISVEDDFWDKHQTTHITQLIKKLPENYVHPMMLRYLYDYDYESIAQLTGLKASNVRKRVQRGKQIIARKLKILEKIK